MSFRMDERLREQLEEIARRNDRTLSGEIRQALKAYIATQHLATEPA